MSEQEQKVTVNVRGKEIVLAPTNGYLFTFIGDLAMYDHVFVVTGQDENSGQKIGEYIFSPHEKYPALFHYMLNHKFPAHLNMPDIAPVDVTEFENRYLQDVRSADTVPTDWIPQQRHGEA